jgi:capsular polysaccharide transport system permease protein
MHEDRRIAENGRPSSWIWAQRNVLLAVILQDMKTRFGASYASYLIAIAWPLAHLAIIVIGYVIINHYAPVGDDPLVFVITAAIPYMLCLYPSRLISGSILVNRPFLTYNVVSPLHLIIARSVLEFLNVAVVIVIVLIVCYSVDSEIAPLSASEAASALGASLFFGLALGFFFAIFTAVIGQFGGVFVVVFIIALYISSFALFPNYLLSSSVRNYLELNPMYGLISWLRAAYYPSYQLSENPKAYILCVSLAVLFLGLLGERSLRGRICGA